MKDKKIVFGILGLLACVILGLFCFYIKRSDEECVGYYMGDLTIEPIVFRDEIYLPNPAYPYDENRDFDLDMKLCGNIKNQYLYENKGKLKIPLYYMGYFWVDQVWVDKKYTEYEHIEVRGGYTNEYTKATYLENPSRIYQLFEEYSNCMLISKEYTSENQCTVPKEIIEKLEEEFGECTYDVKDFDEMAEAYFVTTNPYFQSGECSNVELQKELKKDLPRRGHVVWQIK